MHDWIQLQFSSALWARQLEVWTSDPKTQQLIANRLGWLQAIDVVTPVVPRLRAFADSVAQSGFTDVVLLGMGGSSLAPEVLRQVLCPADRLPRFRVLDSVDPDAVRAAMVRARDTLFVVASKSGSTIEPNVMAEEAKRRVIAEGHANWGTRFVAITDPDTALHRRATAEGFRDVFVNPRDIGGRYSALSLFGMVPAALIGLDLDELLAGGRAMEQACRLDQPRENPGLALGALMGAAALGGRDKLTLWVPPQLQSFGLWVEQLVGESTGKQRKGIVPVTGEPADVRLGDDRVVVALSAGALDPPGVDRLGSETYRTHVSRCPDVGALGAEFLRWEVATATAGLLLDINPFDEPNVQQAKDATRVLLDHYRQQRQLPFPESHGSAHGTSLTLSEPAVEALGGNAADGFLQVVRPADYVALLAYLPPDDPKWDSALQAFRRAIASAEWHSDICRLRPSISSFHRPAPQRGRAERRVHHHHGRCRRGSCRSLANRIRLVCWRWRRRSGISSRSIARDAARCSFDFESGTSGGSRTRGPPGRNMSRPSSVVGAWSGPKTKNKGPRTRATRSKKRVSAEASDDSGDVVGRSPGNRAIAPRSERRLRRPR